jgi:hypothetical protein
MVFDEKSFDEMVFDKKTFDEVDSMKWRSMNWYGAKDLYTQCQLFFFYLRIKSVKK